MPSPFDPRLARASQSASRYLVLTSVMGVATASCVVMSAVFLAALMRNAVVTGKLDSFLDRDLLIGFAATVVLRTSLAWLHGRYKHHAAPRAVAELQNELLQRMVLADQRIARENRDVAMTLLTRELDGIRHYLAGYLPSLVLCATVTPLTVIALFLIDPLSGIIVVGGVPLVVLFMILVGRFTQGRSDRRLGALSQLSAELMDVVEGLKTLRALGREFAPVRRIRELGSAHYRATMSTLSLAFLSGLVLEFLTTLCVAMVAVEVGLRLVYGQMSLETGLLALILAPEVFLPIRAVGAQFHAAQDGVAACTATMDLCDRLTPRRRGKMHGDKSAPLRVLSLQVKGRDGYAPNGICAEFRSGEIAVMVGRNGSGKTTTLGVLLGLIDPEPGGDALLGNISIRDLEPQWWWQQVTWLPQQVSAQNPQEAASLGQKQLRLIAEALACTTQVYLFDEPTAHLDAVSEQRVLNDIRAKADQGATIILVSHRTHVMAAADQIISLDQDQYRLTGVSEALTRVSEAQYVG